MCCYLLLVGALERQRCDEADGAEKDNTYGQGEDSARIGVECFGVNAPGASPVPDPLGGEDTTGRDQCRGYEG
jgi:hypothetical protein